ncbi:hypothetical protein CDAR_400221 [Caerostris darwini]|uniref:Uncharacterized protein n=1 Tax=Caerostris darwini TaxID=1538125 RepID=A0AAV4SHR3_9ARAC|nr:hypothetical protein CDAR_400221 [Caerostris darwini]
MKPILPKNSFHFPLFKAVLSPQNISSNLQQGTSRWSRALKGCLQRPLPDRCQFIPYQQKRISGGGQAKIPRDLARLLLTPMDVGQEFRYQGINRDRNFGTLERLAGDGKLVEEMSPFSMPSGYANPPLLLGSAGKGA